MESLTRTEKIKNLIVDLREKDTGEVRRFTSAPDALGLRAQHEGHDKNELGEGRRPGE